MSKKAKREQKPTPVGETVAAEMETRAAYQNLIQSFTSDQHELEAKIKEIKNLMAHFKSNAKCVEKQKLWHLQFNENPQELRGFKYEAGWF